MRQTDGPNQPAGPRHAWTRRQWCAAVGATAFQALVGCEPARRPELSDDPLSRAVNWLGRQQSTDGGWHSAHYAPLRGGRALTPFILCALQQAAPSGNPDQRGYSRALDFIAESVNAQGVVGADDSELLEYPNYATAFALRMLVRENRPEHQRPVKRMRGYLISQQFAEDTGFGPEHPAYGGWGFGGGKPRGGAAGHVDIAHTRQVLLALRLMDAPPATFVRAERFLALLQKQPVAECPQPSSAGITRPAGWQPRCDGGFYFSPVVYAANKGGEDSIDEQPCFRSYATATCEGILALLACGVSLADPRIQQARKWLERHPRLDLPEGVHDAGDTNWATSIRFDHFAVRAECYQALAWPGPWREELRELLKRRQHADGSFANHAGFLMKEDDPLVCTTLAVIALAATGRPA